MWFSKEFISIVKDGIFFITEVKPITDSSLIERKDLTPAFSICGPVIPYNSASTGKLNIFWETSAASLSPDASPAEMNIFFDIFFLFITNVETSEFEGL